MFGTKTKEKTTPFPSTVQLLPFLSKMGEFLKKGFEHYVQMSMAGSTMDNDMLQAFIFVQMGSWNPRVQGKNVLDLETKKALAQFLAGVVINLQKKGE